jgi:hypothetical protein
MPSNLQNPLPPLFMGEFRHAIDGKGRITTPSDWRVTEEAEFFLIPTSNDCCLKVMPRQETSVPKLRRYQSPADRCPSHARFRHPAVPARQGGPARCSAGILPARRDFSEVILAGASDIRDLERHCVGKGKGWPGGCGDVSSFTVRVDRHHGSQRASREVVNATDAGECGRPSGACGLG